MKRREFLSRSICTGGAIAASTAAQSSPESNAHQESRSGQMPNILFIMTDQQRFDCVGANGNPIIQTPNLDALAAGSANFSHAYIQAPVCTPSRACFFTGRYAHAHQNRVNYTELKNDEILMTTRLQNAGYRTAIIGKSHVYYRYPPTHEEAHRIGFDLVDLHDGVRRTDPWSHYTEWRNENDPLADICAYRDYARNVPQLRDKRPPSANPFRSAIDDEYTDTTWTGMRTRERLKELAKENQPFFVFSSFWKPHSPFEVPSPFDSVYNDEEIPLPKQVSMEYIRQLPLPLQKLILRGDNPPFDMDRERLQWIYRSYYGTVSHIDREVGLILQTLEETGLADNTIVVFTSDHGDQLLEHGLMGKNVFFESSIHVPFMIRFPGRIQPGNYNEFFESVDLLSTLFEFIGLPEPYECHGRSFVPLITGSKDGFDERDAVFIENVIPEVFLVNYFRFDKGKGIKGIRHPDAKMVRTREWKYCYYPEGYAELYNLQNDPEEMHNLALDPQHKPVADELKGRILDWLITATETDQIAPTWLI